MDLNKMSIEEALKKYRALVRREKNAREEKKIVRGFLIEAGVDMDGSVRREQRNKKMFKLFQKGATNKEIAQKIDLTVARIQHYRERFERDGQM